MRVGHQKESDKCWVLQISGITVRTVRPTSPLIKAKTHRQQSAACINKHNSSVSSAPRISFKNNSPLTLATPNSANKGVIFFSFPSVVLLFFPQISSRPAVFHWRCCILRWATAQLCNGDISGCEEKKKKQPSSDSNTPTHVVNKLYASEWKRRTAALVI